MGLILAYVLAALFLAGPIGRHNPGLSALLRPPYFAFSQQYEAGTALGFRIGDRAPDVIARAVQDKYLIETACWGNQSAVSLAKPNIILTDKITSTGVVCLRRDKTLLEITFRDNLAISVRVSYSALDVVT